jgi:predicted transcriptional regulator
VINGLPARERQIFEALYARGRATAAEIHADLPDAPSNSAVRIMLGRLEKKGFVSHRIENKAYVYAPALPNPKVRQSAIESFVRTFFGGSPAGAAAALIGMSESVDDKELETLEAMIAKARREQSQ